MKSIFSTQNLQTFFLRKYWRLPRRGPPGPFPGGGPPSPPLEPPPLWPPPCPPPPSRLGGAPLGAWPCLCSSAMPSTLSLEPPNLLNVKSELHFAANFLMRFSSRELFQAQ